MVRNPKFFRAMMAAFGFALLVPVAMTIVSDTASASGYIYLSGRNGDAGCVPADGDDCAT